MSATLTRPLPACVAPPPPAPCCGWCEGSGAVADDDLGDVCCLDCGGTGAGDWVAPCELVLDPTHTHKTPGRRRAVYDPARKLLTLTQGRRARRYEVREFAADREYGRAFEVVKESSGEVRHFRCGPAGVSCDCEGDSYRANPKANQRALEVGDAVFPSYGCVHADSLVPLLRAGWFDLGT